jgi:hypothetical protein
MNSSNAKYPFVLAILYGILAPFLLPQVIQSESVELFLIPLGLIYFFGGSLFGFIWPRPSWRWGFWIAGPMIALIGLSVLFTGKLEVFFNKDLLILILPITSACLGSFILSWFRHRSLKATEQ